MSASASSPNDSRLGSGGTASPTLRIPPTRAANAMRVARKRGSAAKRPQRSRRNVEKRVTTTRAEGDGVVGLLVSLFADMVHALTVWVVFVTGYVWHSVPLTPLRVVVQRCLQWPAQWQFRRISRRYLAEMSQAHNYEEYSGIAAKLDDYGGFASWQTTAPPPSQCNAKGLLFDVHVMQRLAQSKNRVAMAYFLRSMLSRNAHGVTQPALYAYFTGSKACVEDYHQAVEGLIQVFAGSRGGPAPDHPTFQIRSCWKRPTKSCSWYHHSSQGHGLASGFIEGSTPVNQSLGAVDLAELMALSPRKRAETPAMTTTTTGAEKQQQQQQQEEETPLSGSRRGKRRKEHATKSQQPPSASSSFSVDLAMVISDDTSDEEVEDLGGEVVRRGRRVLTKMEDSMSLDSRHARHSSGSGRSSSGRRTLPPHVAGDNADHSPAALEDHLPGRSQYLVGLVHHAETHTNQSKLPGEKRLHVLSDALRSYGRTALVLSGGASLATYHMGVVRALHQADVLPSIVCGSSAGAAIAALVCCKTTTELDAFLESDVLSAEMWRRTPFGPDATLAYKVLRFTRYAVRMELQALVECVRSSCGDMTFAEAYSKSGKVLSVSVSSSQPAGSHSDRHMLLNYLSAPDVLIWSAVSASCALPGLLPAVQLVEKTRPTRRTGGSSGGGGGNHGDADSTFQAYRPGELWYDGSVSRDVPRQRLAETFNVKYCIVSQLNPLVIPFLPPPPSSLFVTTKTSWLGRCWYALFGELQHWLVALFRCGLLPRSGWMEIPYLMLTQNYYGNVTVFPLGHAADALQDYLTSINQPVGEYLRFAVQKAQLRTWPQIPRIKEATRVERALVREIHDVERRLHEHDTLSTSQ